MASWADRHKTIGVSNHLCLLDGGGSTVEEGSGQVMSPWRMSYRLFASDLATINSTCWRPLVSRHSGSTTENWPDAIGAAPEKRTKRRSGSLNVTMCKDREIESQTEQHRKGFKGKYLGK